MKTEQQKTEAIERWLGWFILFPFRFGMVITAALSTLVVGLVLALIHPNLFNDWRNELSIFKDTKE